MNIDYLALMRMIVSFGVVLIASCNSGVEEQDSFQQSVPYAELYELTNIDVAGIDKLDSVINYLSKDSVVDDRHVGIGGVQSTTYAHFIRLKELASDSMLEELIQHENPVVRVYSYWALIERNYAKTDALMQIAANDSTPVQYMSGCIMSVQPLVSIVQRKWNNFKTPVN